MKIKKTVRSHRGDRHDKDEAVKNLEQMSLITPTRLMFEKNEVEYVEYHMKDGRTVIYEVVEEDDI